MPGEAADEDEDVGEAGLDPGTRVGAWAQDPVADTARDLFALAGRSAGPDSAS